MAYNIALQFEDGVTRIVEARDDQLVIDAAARAGVILPFGCRDGNCGACKSFCEAGQYKHQAYSYNAMTTREARQRYVLTCKMVALSDCAIRVPSASHACNVQPPRCASKPKRTACTRGLTGTLNAAVVVSAARNRL